MRKVYKKITQYIAFILCVVLVLQGFVVPGNGSWNMTAEAADFSNALTYEDDFKYSDMERLLASEQWDVENQDNGNTDKKPSAGEPMLSDGVIKMTSKTSLQFNWQNVSGIGTYDASKTYTFEFDATVTDKGQGNNVYWTANTHTRVLYVAPGGWYDQIAINDVNGKIRAGDTYLTDWSEDTFVNQKLHIKLEWTGTTITSTITDAAENILASGSRTNASYTPSDIHMQDLVLRCEDGAVEIDNFTFTDGTTNYIQRFGDVLSGSVWDIENESNKYDGRKKADATAPKFEDGVIKMTDKNSVQFNWKEIPGINSSDTTNTYTFEFDAIVTDKGKGNDVYWTANTHTRVLYVAPGGWYDQVAINDVNGKIRAGDTYLTDWSEDTFVNQKLHIKLEWDLSATTPIITSTITDAAGNELASGFRTSGNYTPSDSSMQDLVLRCEDGAVEIDNFEFRVNDEIRYAEDFGVNSIDMMLTTSVWDVENQGNGNTNKKPSAGKPVLSDGVIKMTSKTSLQFNWKNVPEIGEYDASKVYAFEFDATVTDKGKGNNVYWTSTTHTRVLYVAPGGWYDQVAINDVNGKIRAGDTYLTDWSEDTFVNQKLHIKLEWLGNTITSTITDATGKELVSGFRTSASYTPSDINMQDLVLRCEDGAVEIENFKFAKKDSSFNENETQVDIPENQQAAYKCTVQYNEGSETRVGLEGINSSNAAVTGQLFAIGDNGLAIGQYACEGVFEPGTYQFTVCLNPVQKAVNVEVTLPDNKGVIRRGAGSLLYGATTITKVISQTLELEEPLVEEVSYVDIQEDDYTLNTEKPVYEGFEANVYNLVTSFDGDAKTTRTFVWTALESFVGDAGMSLRYRISGTSEWTTVEAVRENESVEYETEDYFEVDLTGLIPGTIYEYQIGKNGSETEWGKTYTFTTEKENVKEFSFVAIGDTQPTNWNGSSYVDKGAMYAQVAIQQAVANTDNPAFILHTGDVSETGWIVDNWNQYFKALGEVGTTIPHFAAIGNHDVSGNTDNFDLHFNHPSNGANVFSEETLAAMKDFIKNPEETVYSWNYGEAHFVVLNTGVYDRGIEIDEMIIEAQREWLQKDLEANKDADWTVIMIHQPVYHRKGGNESRPWLSDVIDKYGVDLVLQGHSHLVTRTYPIKDGKVVSKNITDTIEKGVGTVYTTVGATTTNHDGLSAGIKDNYYLAFTPDLSQPAYTTVTVQDSALKVTVKQVNGLVIDEFVIEAPKVEYEYCDNISKYRAGTKSYEEKEGYVFAGWWQGEATDVITDDTDLVPISEGTTSGGAWAKYVPEDTLSVKAQSTNRMIDNPSSTKLRLVTSVDSLRYREVGFKIRYNQGNKEYTHSTKTVYERISALDENDIQFKYRPGIFDNVSDYFMAYTITGIDKALFDNYEFAVTPYWITLDGTTVKGAARERLLVSDERSLNEDGRDFTVAKSTYTYRADKSSDNTVSYQYFAGSSDTVYVEGTYTKADANAQFGISIRNGGEVRQILFAQDGVAVVNQAIGTNGLVGEIKQVDAGAINAMLEKASGTDVKITWKIVDNVLSCNLDGTLVYEIDMTDLCAAWKDGRYYQVGLAGYNTADTTGTKFVRDQFTLGK